ncbi:hypothetical protein SLEP1_g24273 [Rubroshorea leprosula]|uniref:Reverse transcriptase domain-containing protein n=1 Tax=Rubroshorea leprosula TaxID=152421 RepID=A0AAV5JPB7_9ROSI|nr:hypothetical protein SLEP1_g24273 [Rubroshorea leprosula]
MVNTRSVRARNSSQPLGREGGDENQPHNSAHNLASTANQDVVAAQLASMQQQFAPQQNLEPVLHAPALSESQGQSHIEPAQQPLPDDVTRRLDSLKKLVAEQRGAPPPHHAADSVPHPLNTNITLKPYPAGFKIPQLETYDGMKDPNDHLHAFYSFYLQGQSTLIQKWRLLFPQSFPVEVLKVSSFDHTVGIAAVISGLNHERFIDSLLKHPATTFSKVNDRSLKFITVEEYALSQKPTPSKNQNPDWRDENPSRMRTAQSPRPDADPHTKIRKVELSTSTTVCSAPDIMYYHYFESLWSSTITLRWSHIWLQQPTSSSRRDPNPERFIWKWLNLCDFFSLVSGGQDAFLFQRSTLKGNQEVARHCYLTLATRPQKDKDQPAENPPQEIHDNQQVMGLKSLITDLRMKPELLRACPKDCYPMPNIDKLVEAASGNKRLSLLDAYSGYHQVLMALEDEEKTSFYAGDEIYCYVMMPFGLKNIGATYQKMVTIVFRAQIGWNLEVYVDDIVVKSLKAEDHLTDLEKTFNNLRKNRMRLNPAKCIFGVESGKFLGFMVSRREIEVNPKKIKAVAEMEPPKSIKDVQRLTGRVKDESGKQKKFEWNLECQAAFDELKFYFSSPPLLTKANEGEILYLYLGILDEAISSMLVREEGKQPKPVYYTSSVLHGVEIRYSIAEKATLAVKPECSGRLIKWAVELGEFEITFHQRLDSWILYVDGASSNKGFGAGAILLGPDGDSQLVVNQVNSVCEVVDPVMMKYATLVAELKSKFQKFHLSKIPRPENERADSLSKMASDGNQSSRSVFVYILDEPSFLKPKMMEISTDPSTPSWTDPIISFLRDGTVPADKQEEMI